MMDLIPTMVDGAVVYNLQNSCIYRAGDCEHCPNLAVYLHNWLKQIEQEYLVIDLQDEKEICPAFLESMFQLYKRLKYPFLFAGIMDQSRSILEGFNYGVSYPFFVTPEDAVRALRMQHPGITESIGKFSVPFGSSLYKLLRSNYQQGDPEPQQNFAEF